MDGKTPSGFTDSTYRVSGDGTDGGGLGGGDNVTPDDKTETTDVNQMEVKSLTDLLFKAKNFDEFLILFSKNWWTVFVWFNIW